MNKIGQKFRSLRSLKGWSQEQVAKRLGISTPAYCNIEKGQTDIVLSRLEQVSLVYEVSVISFFEQHSDAADLVSDMLREKYEQLHKREAEVSELQWKLIGLYEELKSEGPNSSEY